MKYLCHSCANELGVVFIGLAINEVGRKHCSKCGSTSADPLHILDESDKTLDELLADIDE